MWHPGHGKGVWELSEMQVWVKKGQVLTCCYPADFIKVIQCFQECVGSGVFKLLFWFSIRFDHLRWAGGVQHLFGRDWWKQQLQQWVVSNKSNGSVGWWDLRELLQPGPGHGFSLGWHIMLWTPDLRDAEAETEGNSVVSCSVSVNWVRFLNSSQTCALGSWMDAIYSSMSLNAARCATGLPGATWAVWHLQNTHWGHQTPSASPFIWCSEVKEMLNFFCSLKTSWSFTLNQL